MQPTRIVLMRVPRKERAKFMIWQVLTESCLHKGHGWFLPRKVHESTRYDVSRRRAFPDERKDQQQTHDFNCAVATKKVPPRPSQTRTLSNLVPLNHLWQLVFSRKSQPQHPMVQNLKPRFQHPNLPQRIITWGILQFKIIMAGFRWLNQELQLLLRRNCDGLRELVLHVHRCPKLAKAAKHLG